MKTDTSTDTSSNPNTDIDTGNNTHTNTSSLFIITDIITLILSSKYSRDFNIHAGVRQGCVLSPRLFCSVLQHAMCKWRSQHLNSGLDLHDGLANLLDLRFADDILLFAK